MNIIHIQSDRTPITSHPELLSRIMKARCRTTTKEKGRELALEVKHEIVSLLKDAVNCGIISSRFPVECTWLSVTPSTYPSEDGTVTMKVMYDIRAFGFLVTKEHIITKSQIMLDYLMVFGNMNESQKQAIFNANSQEEYLAVIGED